MLIDSSETQINNFTVKQLKSTISVEFLSNKTVEIRPII